MQCDIRGAWRAIRSVDMILKWTGDDRFFPLKFRHAAIGHCPL